MYIYIYLYVRRSSRDKTIESWFFLFQFLLFFAIFFFFSFFLLSILSSNFVTWRERLGWGEIGNV